MTLSTRSRSVEDIMRATLPLGLIISLLSSTSFAADAVCIAQQQALDGIGSKYKPQFDGYQQEGEDIKKSATSLNFKVTWDNVDLIFGLPNVSLKDKDIILGLPQVTMKTQELIFGTPSIRMERHKTGEYPEFTCDHAVIPSCTVHWSPIYIDVPVPFLQEQHVKMDIPEFIFANTKITFGVPEFSIQQVHWIVGLPQFKLDSIYINSGPLKDRSDALQAKISSTRSSLVSETAADIHELFDCERSNVEQQRADASAKFNSGISIMDAVIQSIRTQGGDPTKMPDGTDLVAKRASLDGQRIAALAMFDDALAKLTESERNAIASLGGASAPTVGAILQPVGGATVQAVGIATDQSTQLPPANLSGAAILKTY